MSDGREEGGACANCGEPMQGPYCAACGQSEKDIRLPILTLASEAADGLLSWDGRLLATLRALYTRPGQVARDYCDGKRVAHTAPVRLYLLVSLVFFAVMAIGGVRVVAIELSPSDAQIAAQDPEEIAERRERLADGARRTTSLGSDGDVEDAVVSDGEGQAADAVDLIVSCGVEPGPDEIAADGGFIFARDTNLIITLFQHGEAPSARRLNPEMELCFQRDVEAAGVSSRFSAVAITALTDPGAFERRAAAAAGQALILMVGAFILMNMALHPRRRIIEQVVHALYFHAAYLPVLATAILLARLVDGFEPGQIALAGSTFLFVMWLIWAYDRGFYASSWWGGLLRLIPLAMGYTLVAGLIAIGLLLLPTF